MLIPSSKPRHTVEKSDNLVRVTLPSKKNVFYFLFVGFWFYLWGYLFYGLSSIRIEANKTVETGSFFFYISICLSFFFLALLAMGIFGVSRVGWLLAGKEVIETTPQTLTITRQIYRWKKSKEYSAEKIRGLRTNTQSLSMFLPERRVKRFLGGGGMIAFDYEAKTFTFGLNINETEAKQIILAVQEGLSQQTAG